MTTHDAEAAIRRTARDDRRDPADVPTDAAEAIAYHRDAARSSSAGDAVLAEAIDLLGDDRAAEVYAEARGSALDVIARARGVAAGRPGRTAEEIDRAVEVERDAWER